MQPPVTFQDKSDYRRRMNNLLTLDRSRTVLVTVDMQREYLDMEIGASPVAPDDAERVLKHSRDLLDFARGEGLPVVHAYVMRRSIENERGVLAGQTFQTNLKHKLSQNAQRGVRTIPDRQVGSPQAEVPAILVAPTDVHMTTKKSLDSYLDTDLDFLLRRVYQADAVVLCGINTDTCVYSTAFSTSNRGYKTVVISDCVASMRGKDNHWMALELMSRSIAWVLTVEEFKEKLR